MNILILTDYYPPDKLGGVGEIAKNLARTYEAKGYHTWVLTTGKKRKNKRVIRSSPSLIKGVFLNNIKAVQLIRKQKIDVVNMHQSTTTLFLLTRYIPFLYKRFPKVINSFQVSYFSEFKNIKSVSMRGKVFKPARSEFIEKWVNAPIHILLDFIGFACADEVTVVSRENKKEFESTYGRLSRKQIKIIPNGVDTNRFTPKKSNLDKLLLKKIEAKTVLLYVGVFRVRKRVFNLLYSFQSVIKSNSNVILILVGGGRAYEKDIVRLIDELELQDNVIFVGKVPNNRVPDYLNAADIFCLLSAYEGMPVAILEAMASGTAILTSKVSGMVDLVENGSDGLLANVDNLDEITKKLKKLVSNPEQTKKMGENGRVKVKKDYNWDTIANKYIGLFE